MLTAFPLRLRLVGIIGLFAAVYAATGILLFVALHKSTESFADLNLNAARSRLQRGYLRWQMLPAAQRPPLGDFLQRQVEPWPGVEVRTREGHPVWPGGEPSRRRRAAALELGGLELSLETQVPPGLILEVPVNREGFFRVVLRLALLILFAGGCGTLVSRHLRAALSPFPAALRHIAEGHFEERLAPVEDPDLQPVVEEFNRLAQRLETTERELSATAQRLSEAPAHKARVLAMVSHELRTPLTAVLGYADRLPPAPQARLRQCGQRLLDRLSRLLEWARLDAGQLRPHLEEFELNEVLEAALEGAAEPEQLALWPEPVLVRGDFRWLTRAFSSLLSGEVTRLEVTAVEPEVLVELSCSGQPQAAADSIGPNLSLEECAVVLRALGGRIELSPGRVRVWLPPAAS